MSGDINAAPTAPFVSSSEAFSGIPQRVIDHIEEGIYKVKKPDVLVCIDGRSNGKQTFDGGTTPGGTLGTLATLFTGVESISPRLIRGYRKQVWEILKEQIGGAENVYYHTDMHCCSRKGVGCGHLRLAIENEKDYGLSNGAIEFIQNIRNKIYGNSAQVVLEGNHEETHVLTVEGETHSVIPNNTIGQAFVYTDTLVQTQLDFLSQSVSRILEIDPDTLLTAIKETHTRHLGNTVKHLAPKLAHYSVKFTPDGKIAEVQERKKAA